LDEIISNWEREQRNQSYDYITSPTVEEKEMMMSSRITITNNFLTNKIE